MLKFSINDAANSVRKLRSYKTPAGINAAVTWFIQGTQFGLEASEADQERRLIAFLGNLCDLADKIVSPLTVKEVYGLMVKPDKKSEIIQFQKDLI